MMNIANDRIQLGRNVLSFIFSVGLALGGIVFVLYCLKIGYFPQDISFGDGVLFIFLAITFGFLYLSLVLWLTSIGLIARPVLHILQKAYMLLRRIKTKITGNTSEYIPFTIEAPIAPLYAYAVAGLFFFFDFNHFNLYAFALLMICAFLCALMWSTYLQNHREIKELIEKDALNEEESLRLKQKKELQPAFISAVFLTPLIISGITGKLLDAAMRMSNLRIDSAVVHIKEPYATYMNESGVDGEKSKFGSDYYKYSDVNILFRGIGKYIVVEKNNGKNEIPLTIPADSIFILKAKKK